MTRPKVISVYFNKHNLDLYLALKALDLTGYSNLSHYIIEACREKIEYGGPLARILAAFDGLETLPQEQAPPDEQVTGDDFFNQRGKFE